jgi:predicted nucleic acid-binding protein
MEQSYLIDTNAIVDFLSFKLPVGGMNFLNEVIDSTPTISVITKIELLSFTTDGEYQSLLSDFVNDSSIIGLDEDIINSTVQIRRKYKPKTPDAIIAATAIQHGLTLITRNFSDFNSIKNLKCLNPYKV